MPNTTIVDNDDNSRIKYESVETCCLCGSRGTVVYGNLQDRLFGVPGSWNLVKCCSEDCRLLWLDPKPVASDIGKLYADYCTHAIEQQTKKTNTRIRSLIECVGPHLETIQASYMWLNDMPAGRILDVGCGSGLYLRKMKSIGWEVYGVEPDPKAAAIARDTFGLDVRQGDLAESGFSDDMFDAVTLNHVIEHVSDPIEQLRECKRVLKPGGLLVVTTPNADSLCHIFYKNAWLDLDPPRHLHIFSRKSIAKCALSAKIGIVSIKTCSRLSNSRWFASMLLRRNYRIPGFNVPPQSSVQKLFANVFHLLEYVLSRFVGVGEEVVLLGVKESSST